ncbi:MAG TPA: hypothetical protein VEC38_13545 [Candidatus Binataceae bacterium]|nr:hypothetical protein [Candidatus Binataceae bacterium]
MRARSPQVISLLRYSPAMVAVLAVAASSNNIADIDLWGHLRFGADALARGHLFMRDPYAYSIPGLPWVSHEWLSEIVLAWMYAKLGVVGLKLVRFACAAAMVIFLAGAVGETSAAIGIQLAALGLAVIALMPEMEFRPQAFSYAMLSAVMWLIARDNYGRRAPLWIAIPMLALWCNLHGGFVIGLAALGIYTGWTAFIGLRERSGRARALRLGAITGAAAVATLLTPYGLGAWRSVMRTISRPPMINEIVEWKPLAATMVEIWHMPGFSFVFDCVIVIILAALAVSVLIAPRGRDGGLLAIAGVMIAAAISAFRNVPLAVIGSVTPLARHFALACGMVRAGASREAAGGMPRAHTNALTESVLAMLAVVLAIWGGVFSRAMEMDFTFPAGAVAFMQQHRLAGNILCKFAWDDYVLYHRLPEDRVFLDTRYEMIYPDRIAREYEDFYHGRAGAAGVLDGYRHDYVMLGPAAEANRLMRSRSDWVLIYRDRDSLLYARAGSAAAQIPGIPVTGTPPAPSFP